MIIGQPGSGKSTLARAIGERTGLPVVHVDMIHWMSGWQEREQPEKLRLAHIEEARDKWVIEGGLSATWDNRLSRADTVVWLDFPFWLRTWRVFRRTVRDYGRSRADLPDDCPERFDPEFWKWIWDTRYTGREIFRKLVDRAPDTKHIHILRTRRQVTRFLKGLE